MKNSNDLEKRLDELERELTKKKHSSFLKTKFSFLSGAVVALSLSTVIAYALTKPFNFTSGTPISATEMNQNFDVLYQAVGQIASGFVAYPSVDTTVTCSTSASSFEEAVMDETNRNDGLYEPVSGEFTVTRSGYYRLYIKFARISGSYEIRPQLSVNGTPLPDMPYSADITRLVKLEVNDIVTLQIACDNKKDADLVYSAAGSYFAIVPL